MAKIDLTNKRFGSLIALEGNRDLYKKDRSLYWKCLCDCGNICYVRSNALTGGRTKSCGCQREFLRSEKISLKYGTANINQIIKNYKTSAERRALKFNKR